jgi:hypothetical protein
MANSVDNTTLAINESCFWPMGSESYLSTFSIEGMHCPCTLPAGDCLLERTPHLICLGNTVRTILYGVDRLGAALQKYCTLVPGNLLGIATPQRWEQSTVRIWGLHSPTR